MSSAVGKMNRKQRREYAKNINTYSKLKGFEKEFIAVQEKKKKEEIDFAKHWYLEIIMTMTAYTLSYKLGLGKKRLPWIMDAILNNIDSFNTGHLTTEDFYTIKEEVKKLGFDSDCFKRK